MLAGLALKWRWRERRRASAPAGDRPNLVLGINVQGCWERFCRYRDVEPRYAMVEASAVISPPRRPSRSAMRTRSGSSRCSLAGSRLLPVREPRAHLGPPRRGAQRMLT